MGESDVCHFQAWPLKMPHLQACGFFSTLAGLNGDNSQDNHGHPVLKIVEPHIHHCMEESDPSRSACPVAAYAVMLEGNEKMSKYIGVTSYQVEISLGRQTP